MDGFTDAGSSPADSTNFMNIEIIGWVATAILLFGYYLNAKKYIYSWLVWLTGNTAMLIYAWLIESHSVAFLSIALMGLNLYGYFSWKSEGK